MRIVIDSFRGMAPRLTPRALPPNGAQIATNAKLLSGDLEAYRQFLLTKQLANDAPVRSIYLLDNEWLSWGTQVDVARGIIPGDNTFRIYLTGPDEYNEPRWTNYALATTGAEPFPVETRPIGVPPPDSVPTVAVGVDSSPTTYSIDITDEGDVLEGNWIISPARTGSTRSVVSQDATTGNPAPSYRLEYDEIHNEGEQPYMLRNFGIGSATAVRCQVDIAFGGDTSFMQGIMNVATTQTGIGGAQVGFNNRGALYIATAPGYTPFSAPIAQVGIAAPLPGTWYTLIAEMAVNGDGTATVTATLMLGATEIASVTGTGAFDIGDWCGFTNGIPDDAGAPFVTWYDNLRVQASGSINNVIVNVATSYLFTYVNDIGEESAPSLPSATVLRPDGVSVTVTTPTDLPSGVSSDYGITSKRIYRSVTGATGSIFRLVAEIPLATTDYVDVLTDSELGEELESEGWDLPPDDLEGILALPNGIMAGFRRNQLCFSAQNRPHAWPVAARLNTDTDIVAIGAIDTTVVIGTQSFPYLAIGSSTGDYSMTKLEVPQACVAKLSLAYLTGIGVVFASPDGLIAVAGTGQVQNLTSGIYTREQWQALQPESIIAAAHDDTYFFWCDDEAPIPPEPLTVVFDHIGAVEQYEVLEGYTQASIRGVGAGGGYGQPASGGSSQNAGGGAGFSSRVVSVSGGQTLDVYVGGAGESASGLRQGAGGGGGSAVVRNGAVLWVAGGGAGGGCGGSNNQYPAGAGGGSTGQTAPQERNLSGGGASQTSAGVAPTGQPSQRFVGNNGSGHDGGNGNNSGGSLLPLTVGGFGYGNGGDGATSSVDGGSGGGGGGYFGGASGSGDDGGAGGGGGSGYAPAGTTTQGSGFDVGVNDEPLLVGFGDGGHAPSIEPQDGRIVITFTAE